MGEDARRLVGKNARRLRLLTEISQAEVAERMGIDRAYISGLERGERNPTVVTLWHLAKALGVRMQELFDEPSRPNRSTDVTNNLVARPKKA